MLTIESVKYKNQSTHLYLGVNYLLDVRSTPQRHKNVFLQDKKIILEVSKLSPNVIEKSLWSWYRTQAYYLFQQRLEHFSNLLPWVESVPLLKVRLMKSRWGSCSSQGHISLNLNLIKTPIECIDSVIIHELCHLMEFNHSAKFYKLLSTYNPKWLEQKKHLDALSSFIL